MEDPKKQDGRCQGKTGFDAVVEAVKAALAAARGQGGWSMP